MHPIDTKPNVIIIYADDLGFGDVSCYGANSIPTPNVDRLAARGIKFHSGYATAATSTPSRFSLLTGSYPWRNPNAAILAGDAPAIIDSQLPTMPKMFKNAGYKTGVVGKWHLGLGRGDLDWNKAISSTPNDVGFDYSYILAATNDRVPCVYVENRNVVNLNPADPIEVTYDWDQAFPGQPTGRDNPEMLKMKYSHGHDASIINGVSRIGHMKGGKDAIWNDETMAEEFLHKATQFISENKEQPFFLYYALHQPHVPRIPSPRFKGATPHGPRGDVIVEMDWCIGQLIDTLDNLNLTENTIVIFSSDNGPVLDDGYHDDAVNLLQSHKPAGPLRGGKYSMFDGGTRVPMTLTWPGKVKPGESDALVCHVDLHASFAAMLNQPLSENEALDSLNMLDAFLCCSRQGRSELVIEGVQKKNVLRRNQWSYIAPHDGPAVSSNTNTELGNSPEPQLYDLSQDIGQIRNVAVENPGKAAEMAKRLKELCESKNTRHR